VAVHGMEASEYGTPVGNASSAAAAAGLRWPTQARMHARLSLPALCPMKTDSLFFRPREHCSKQHPRGLSEALSPIPARTPLRHPQSHRS
jgi:hypothetical protein